MAEDVTKAVRNAIDALCQQNKPDFCWQAPDIPADALQAALKRFAAEAADEEVLFFVPSQRSGKSGFLFTDRAVYFGKAMGVVRGRLPYEAISELAVDRKRLHLATPDFEIDWDLTETLLWESSRRKVSGVVVPLLKQIIDSTSTADQHTRAAVDSIMAEQSTSTETLRVAIELEEPVNWRQVLWFQIPVVVFGGFVALPLIYGLLGETGFLGTDISGTLKGYDNLLFISLMAVVPAAYAFGTSLQFSLGRYLVAIAVLAFLVLRALIQAGPLASNDIIVPLGGGLIGPVVAGALGKGGLLIRAQLAALTAQTRTQIARGVVVAVAIAILLVVSRAIENRRYGITGLSPPGPAVVNDTSAVVSTQSHWAIGQWYCENRYTGPDDNRSWLSSMFIGRGDTAEFSWRWKDQIDGRWRQEITGEAFASDEFLTLQSVSGSTMKYQYYPGSGSGTGLGTGSDERLIYIVSNPDSDYVSECCSMHRCSVIDQ